MGKARLATSVGEAAGTWARKVASSSRRPGTASGGARKGFSIGPEAVASALEVLAAKFSGSATSVDVKIITYGSDVTSLDVADLQDPTLPDAIRSIRFNRWLTSGGVCTSPNADRSALMPKSRAASQGRSS